VTLAVLSSLQAWVKNSIWIPMYDLDKHTSIGSLTKQAAHLINGEGMSILNNCGTFKAGLQL
jgi:hypothetical protein